MVNFTFENTDKIPINITCRNSSSYTLLQPISNLKNFDPTEVPGNENPLGSYLNIMIGLIIGIAAAIYRKSHRL